MTDEVQTDQAPVQSVEERIASRFGLTTLSNPETATPVETQETGDGFEDIDWDGVILKAPSDKAQSVKEALMRQSDYTQKTQVVADQLRNLEHARELVQTKEMDKAFEQSVKGELEEIQIIDAYLKQANQIDWAQLPSDQMIRTKIELDQVKERRALIQNSLAEKRNEFQTSLKSKLDELRGKSREVVSKSIQGFSEQTENEIRQFALSKGFANQELDNVFMDPRSVEILHDAMQYRNVKSGTKAAVEKATKAPPVLKPGAASDRMPAETAKDLNFRKAQKSAVTSRDKANAIENRLALRFGQR